MSKDHLSVRLRFSPLLVFSSIAFKVAVSEKISFWYQQKSADRQALTQLLVVRVSTCANCQRAWQYMVT